MTKKQKKTLRRILGSTVLFAVVWAVTALASLPPGGNFFSICCPTPSSAGTSCEGSPEHQKRPGI